MPTRIDGVSSGGVYPAAGVTCAEATTAYNEMTIDANGARGRAMAPTLPRGEIRPGYGDVKSVLLHHGCRTQKAVGLVGAIEPAQTKLLAFKRDNGHEELLELETDPLGEIEDSPHVAESRGLHRNREHAVVVLGHRHGNGCLLHSKNPDEARRQDDAWKRRAVPEHHRVQRIT